MHVEPSAYHRMSSLWDRPLAALLLVATLPFLILLVVLTKLTSPGPGICRQTRVGRQGKLFHMCKVRTMCADAEVLTGPVWCAGKADPRITPLGGFLRRFHLDELPQLWNVVRGDMALVGPRPERPEFVPLLARALPDYQGRLGIRPGITGLAQINLPPDSTIEDVRRKLALDLEYVVQGNAWLDLRLVAWTALRVCGLPGPRLARWFAVHRGPLSQRATGREVEEQRGAAGRVPLLAASLPESP